MRKCMMSSKKVVRARCRCTINELSRLSHSRTRTTLRDCIATNGIDFANFNSKLSRFSFTIHRGLLAFAFVLLSIFECGVSDWCQNIARPVVINGRSLRCPARPKCQNWMIRPHRSLQHFIHTNFDWTSKFHQIPSKNKLPQSNHQVFEVKVYSSRIKWSRTKSWIWN